MTSILIAGGVPAESLPGHLPQLILLNIGQDVGVPRDARSVPERTRMGAAFGQLMPDIGIVMDRERELPDVGRTRRTSGSIPNPLDGWYGNADENADNE